MGDDFVYCSVVDGFCKAKYFGDCAVLKRLSGKWDRGLVFPYDCPRAVEVWLARKLCWSATVRERDRMVKHDTE